MNTVFLFEVSSYIVSISKGAAIADSLFLSCPEFNGDHESL